ncbi:hypothetical protein X767_32680 [Mesorhizobium sp. LSJC264A00]|nr:hypothetical protein X767_32680 [Mesorhizobium sp. LSJC264A00]
MIEDCVLSWLSILGTIGSKLSDRNANLVEWWLNLRDIASVPISQGMGNNLAAVGIQCKAATA